MRILSCGSLLALTLAFTLPARAAQLGQPERAALAEQAVRNALRPYGAPNRFSVRALPLKLIADPAPITGGGPIEVKVRQFPGGGPMDKQRLLVNVDRAGQVQLMSRQSDTRMGRLKDALRSSTSELVHDILSSKGVREGLVTGSLGFTAAQVSPEVAAAAALWAGKQIVDGVARRRDAREQALGRTVSWAKASGERGAWPTLGDAYRRYRAELEVLKPGTSPVTVERFVRLLSAQGL